MARNATVTAKTAVKLEVIKQRELPGSSRRCRTSPTGYEQSPPTASPTPSTEATAPAEPQELGAVSCNCSTSTRLRILSVGLRGRASTSSSCSGIFCVIRPAWRQCSDIAWNAIGSAPAGGLDHGAHALAAFRVGKPDHGDRRHRWVGHQHVFDLAGADVLALADDHLLAATGDHHVAVGAHVAAITGDGTTRRRRMPRGCAPDRCSPWRASGRARGSRR